MIAPDRRTRVAIAIVIGTVLASVWLRWPGFTQGGFASHDVAGILYEGMLIGDGALPYVDSIEGKGPGTFYLAALLAGEGSTDIAAFQVWANLWALASLLAVSACAWVAFGARAAAVATVLYALHDAHLDTMDANYVTWMQLPQIAAVALALAGRKRPADDGAWLPFALAGAATGLAAMCKQPGAVVVLPVMLAAWLGVPRRTAVRRLAAVVAGGIAVHVPVLIHYALHGAIGALWSGYIANEWAGRYVAVRTAAADHWLREGVFATLHVLALPVALAAFAGPPPRTSTPVLRHTVWILLAWFLAVLAAAWVGARYYKGYFLAPAAPICILAAVPWGLGGPWPATARARGARLVVAVIAVVLAARAVVLSVDTRRDRGRPHDAGGRTLAEYVAAHSDPADTIWVWGWHLWDVYPLADRRSASRIYKSLGLIEGPNDDTWRSPATPLRFEPSERADMLLADLDRARPKFVLLGGTVPRGEFTALRRFLSQHYVLDDGVRVGRVQIWRRR